MPFFRVLIRCKYSTNFAFKLLVSWNSAFVPKKLSTKEEEAKMFRLFLALSYIFILGTFAVSKNQTVSGNILSLNTKSYRLFVDE